jgi:hypothetical protein
MAQTPDPKGFEFGIPSRKDELLDLRQADAAEDCRYGLVIEAEVQRVIVGEDSGGHRPVPTIPPRPAR